MKAPAYIRVSTAEQEDGASLTEQKRDIEEYCNLKGYELVCAYQDIASGASRNRPAVQANAERGPYRSVSDHRGMEGRQALPWRRSRLCPERSPDRHRHTVGSGEGHHRPEILWAAG